MIEDASRVIPMTTDHRIGAAPNMAPSFPGSKIYIAEEPVHPIIEAANILKVAASQDKRGIAHKYPKYHKSVKHLDSVDIYQVCELFKVEDASGALQHSIKKLLLSGVRTGGKSKFEDIKEARDTLTRWLEINAPGMA